MSNNVHTFFKALLAIVLCVNSVTSLANTASDLASFKSKIGPKLMTTLEETGTSDIVIRFAAVAQLKTAAQTSDWNARGAAVVDVLKAVAIASQHEIIADLEARGINYQSRFINNAIYVNNADSQIVTNVAQSPSVALIEIPEVAWIEPTFLSDTSLLMEAIEWGVLDIGAIEVWKEYTDGSGIVIGVIDTGAQFDHPALAASYRGNQTRTVDHEYNWFNATEKCESLLVPCDDHGHGTHVTGTAVGHDTENKIGVAPGATWIAAKACWKVNSGPPPLPMSASMSEAAICPEEALTAAAQWMLAPRDQNGENPNPAMRPHVIKNSWGGPDSDWFKRLVLAWRAAGQFPSFAAGNSGPACGTMRSPGSYDISYATGAYDHNEHIADFSSRGAIGEKKPDISAPGVDIYSSLPDNQYGLMSGTSMAAPHVAGAVALLWSTVGSLIGNVEETRIALDNSARYSFDDQCGGDRQFNPVYGSGRLDIYSAITDYIYQNWIISTIKHCHMLIFCSTLSNHHNNDFFLWLTMWPTDDALQHSWALNSGTRMNYEGAGRNRTGIH